MGLPYFPGLATQRDTFPTAVRKQGRLLNQGHSFESPRSRGVGALGVAGPLTTSLRGLWVSGLLPPDNGGSYQRAASLEPATRRRGRLGPRAGNPEENLLPAWVLHQGPPKPHCVKGKAPKDPGIVAPLAAAGCCGNCYYDTGGRSHASARSSSSSHSLSSGPWS